jgi:hypothetical protein
MLEIIMLLGGLYAVIAGKIPSSFYGGKGFVIESTPARLIGLLMMTPVPLSFASGLVLALMGADVNSYGLFCELGIVIVVAIIAGVAMNRVRKPVPPSDMSIPPGPTP